MPLEIKCRIIYVKKNKQKTPKKQLTKLNLSDTQTLQSRLFTAIALWFTVECVVASVWVVKMSFLITWTEVL